jgi:hypothetical protein
MSKKNTNGRLDRLLSLSKPKKPRDRYLIVSARVVKPEIVERFERDVAAGVTPTVLVNEALQHYYETQQE